MLDYFNSFDMLAMLHFKVMIIFALTLQILMDGESNLDGTSPGKFPILRFLEIHPLLQCFSVWAVEWLSVRYGVLRRQVT